MAIVIPPAGVGVREALLEVAQYGGEVAYYEVLDQMSFEDDHARRLDWDRERERARTSRWAQPQNRSLLRLIIDKATSSSFLCALCL